VRASEQVGGVRAQGLHVWALGPRGRCRRRALRPSASFGDDAEGMGSEGEYGIAEGQAGDEQ
jgi:hypothetical protein